MLNFDVRTMTDARREALAWRVHESPDFTLPRLRAWNYDLCRVHRSGWADITRNDDGSIETQRTVYDAPKPGCRQCGIIFRSHQRVGVAWLYLKKNGVLADIMGAGKTGTAGGLVAMLIETGEVPTVGRVVIVPRSPALDQWAAELLRMMPGLNVLVATGTKRQRVEQYLQPWDVLLIGPEMLRRDYSLVERFPLALFVADDIDQLRNPEIETSQVMDRVGSRADRYVIMTATPLQKRLPELHAVFDAVGGARVLGPRDYFVARYVRTERVRDVDRRTGQEFTRKQITGYKNLGELKRKMAPMVLRRTEFDDLTLPAIIPNDVMLDLYPAQRAKYEELKQGVVRILLESGDEQVKHATAMSKLHYGSAICAGLAALGEEDRARTSVKMDWILEKVTEGDLSDEKVVVFANLKNTIRALQNRLTREGVPYVTIWGENKNREERSAAQARFWDDPTCKVLLGTRSIEQSLNLHVSRHLINVDMILNAARMQQLAGRIRRDGSVYQHVFVHNLLTVNTQEERYLPLLEREAALSDHIWDENNDLFHALSATALLHLISG